MSIKFVGLARPENAEEERLMSRWRGCVIKGDEFLLWTLGTYKSEELAIRAAQTSLEQSKTWSDEA